MERAHGPRVDRDTSGVRAGEPPARGPVGFRDPGSLQRSLERRRGERRERPRPASAPDLGTRELCHDLRQPLSAATVLAARVGQDPGLGAASRDQLALLQQALSCLSRMVGDHLEPPAPVLVDVAKLAGDVRAALEVDGSRRVELVVEALPRVAGDPVLLARMLGNLVDNARTVAGRTGRVRVVVSEAFGAARLEVEDSGRADGAASAGYGLGLMIAQAVATRHGGSVECAPSALGGLRLRVVLPAAVPPQGAGEQR